MSGAVGGKYLPLHSYLRNTEGSSVRLTFLEIEEILKARLPKSAYEYQAWWANGEKSHDHALAWLRAGFIAVNVSFGEFVEFYRQDAAVDNLSAPKNKIKGIDKEEYYIHRISKKLDDVGTFLAQSAAADFRSKSTIDQFKMIKGFRRIIGNIDNDMSFLGSLLIKEFLSERYSCEELNMALKPQGAPGLDIDIVTLDGKRVIGELKTTYPYQERDLGAKQKESFLLDFRKLRTNKADSKYFFVTEAKTFEIMRAKYSHLLEGVNLALLPEALSDGGFVIEY